MPKRIALKDAITVDAVDLSNFRPQRVASPASTSEST